MARKKGPSVTRIPCLVTPGMFSTEFHVLVKLPDGREIDALVDRSNVEVSEEPRTGKPVEGALKVSVVNYDKRKKEALIDLPEGSFARGPRILVPSDMVSA
jgi:hypothetical protein